jgi:hypothetical protein
MGAVAEGARVGSDKPASVNRREGPAFNVSYRQGIFDPNRTAWSLNLSGFPVLRVMIPSAQGITDIAVRPPPPLAIDAGAGTLVSESTPNGQLDLGEVVTVSLCITNGAAIASGTVNGALLATCGVIAPSGAQSYGAIPSGGTVCRNFTFSVTDSCAATLTATVQAQETGKPARNLTYTFPIIPPAFFSQNFDSVTAPALPAGWSTSTLTGTPSLWVTNSSSPDSPPNRVFAADPSTVSDNVLISPSIAVPAVPSVLTFRHSYNTEVSNDGGVLEIAVGGVDAWTAPSPVASIQ